MRYAQKEAFAAMKMLLTGQSSSHLQGCLGEAVQGGQTRTMVKLDWLGGENAGVVYQVLGHFAAHQGGKVSSQEAFSGYYERS